MAGPKGVVNLLQQFLKTAGSSGTLDAALGTLKVDNKCNVRKVHMTSAINL